MAIIGGGPAGLTAAADLALLGYGVTLFEAQPLLGGMLRYGIPGYRLPEDVLDHEIQYILDLGVEAKTEHAGGRSAEPAEAIDGTAGEPTASSTPSSSPPARGSAASWAFRAKTRQGVWAGLDFLDQVNSGETPAIGPNVVVIGGGDVAMDAARCARRMPGVQVGARGLPESREEMPAHPWEAAEALEEGVVFHTGLGPARIETAGGKVTGVAFRACTRVFDETKRFDAAASTIRRPASWPPTPSS